MVPPDPSGEAPETTPGGSTIRSYREADRVGQEPELVVGETELTDALDAYLRRQFGEAAERAWVLPELVSPTVHLDVHVVPQRFAEARTPMEVIPGRPEAV